MTCVKHYASDGCENIKRRIFVSLQSEAVEI